MRQAPPMADYFEIIGGRLARNATSAGLADLLQVCIVAMCSACAMFASVLPRVH
jgi:hypothetical protein